MVSSYRAIIGCNWNQFQTGSTEPDRYLALDIQEEPQITASSTLCSYPLQSGDTMTDHMYRNPTTVTLTGMFSLLGSSVLFKDTSYDFFQTSQDRLTAIQEIFEKIKDDGILCQITTIKNATGGNVVSNDADSQTRFKQRSNMALSSITWTQMQNSMKFSFTFTEVIMVEVQEYEELTAELMEELNLPRCTSPMGSSLAEVLSNTGKIDELVVRSLYDNGYITNDFLRALYIGGSSYLTAIAVVAITAVAVAVVAGIATSTAAALAIAGSAAAIFPVGTIVAVVAVAAIGIFALIKNRIKKVKEQQKQKIAFDVASNGSTEEGEIRLANLLADIQDAVQGVTTNITIYEIDPQDSNKPQQVMINLGGDYFTIDFKENNTKKDEPWTAEVLDMNDKPVTVQHKWSPQTSLGDLSRNKNMWFRSGKYEVYLMNPNLEDMVNETDAEKKNAAKRLHSYSIWVSYGNVEENAKIIEKAINDAIVNEGFV